VDAGARARPFSAPLSAADQPRQPTLGRRTADAGDRPRPLTNPRLLVLDEATEGLAPIIRDEIWKTIRLIRDTGIATLIVDKAVASVAEVADRIVILVKGEMVFEGSARELKAQPELMHRHLGI
jgi:ABC-type lipopolysaccharide export system ATPase subunit